MKDTPTIPAPAASPLRRTIIEIDKDAIVDWNPPLTEEESALVPDATIAAKRGDNIKGGYPKDILSPYIKAGIVTVLSAKKALGKTTLLTCAAAKLSIGINLFTSEKVPRGCQNSIIYSLEDKDVVTKQRYQEFGGNPKRVYIFDKDDNRYFEDLETIRNDILTIKPGLVIIDSLASFFGTTQSAKKIQEGFSELERIVSKVHCAVVVIHHPAKEVRDSDHWAGGTGRIENYARIGFYIARLDANERLFMRAKWQYDQTLPSFTYNISKPNGHLIIAMTGKNEMDIETYFEQRSGKGCKNCGATLVCSLGCDEDNHEDDDE